MYCRHLVRPSTALVLAAAFHCVQAAELGEAQVRSYIGQPLVADIELLSLTGEEPLQVRLANPDVYQGANISMHPALSSMHSSIMRRDGHQFLHVTSIKPINAEFVHIFFELLEGNKRAVRGVTLWFSADPNPAPPPPPAITPDVALEAAVVRAAMHPVAPHKSPKAVDNSKACAELDYKNGVLTAQIVELEDKVKHLQDDLVVKPAPAPAKASVIAAPAPKPEKKKEPLPWLLIGGGIADALALAGAIAFFLRWKKKRTAAPAEAAAAKEGLVARLLGRFKRKKATEEEHVEPAGDT